jgi:hypothetical protein
VILRVSGELINNAAKGIQNRLQRQLILQYYGKITNPPPRGRPLSNPLKFRGQIICSIWCRKGPTPRLEIPFTPDEPDEPDAGDGVDGVGVGGLATGSSSASGWLVVSELSPNLSILGVNCEFATHRLGRWIGDGLSVRWVGWCFEGEGSKN